LKLVQRFAARDVQRRGLGSRRSCQGETHIPSKIGRTAARLAATLAVSLLFIGASAPQSPEALVAQVYHRLIVAEQKSQGYEPPETFYTPRLKALVAAARHTADGDAPCGLDFIFWFNGQDYTISDLVVTRGANIAPDRTTVTATFKNLGDAEKIVFDFRQIGGRWLLDDAHSLVGDSKWTFSRLLQCKD
jgi:hypothetical protein